MHGLKFPTEILFCVVIFFSILRSVGIQYILKSKEKKYCNYMYLHIFMNSLIIDFILSTYLSDLFKYPMGKKLTFCNTF